MSFPASLRSAALAAAFLAVGAAGAAAQQPQGKVRIAVVDVANSTTSKLWGDQLGTAAEDELVTQLVASGAFSVVERKQLDAVLAEQKLAVSGAMNPAGAAKIGQLLGAQLALTGSITQFSIVSRSAGFGPVRAEYTEAESAVDLRLVDTSTGEVLAVVDGSGKKRFGGAQYKDKGLAQTFDEGVAQAALRPAIEEAVKNLLDERQKFASIAPAAATGHVVGSREQNFYIDQGENDGVTAGQRFDVMRVVDEIKDAQGNVLDKVTKKVGTLQVVRVLSKSSICTIAEGEARTGDTVTPAGAAAKKAN